MRKKGLLNILLQTSRLHSSCKSSNRFTDRSRTRESFSRFFQKNPFLLDHRSLDPPLLPLRARRKRIISGVITIPRIYIPTIRTAATHPRSRGQEGEGVGWSLDDYPKLLPRCCRAFVRRDSRRDATTRRPRLPADPYYGRHCASSRGHRRRHKEAARGSSFPERAPLCPRDYELASISWMEHPPSPPSPAPSPCIMGDDALITATVVATIRFRNRVPYIENARGRAFVVGEAGGRNFRLGIISVSLSSLTNISLVYLA